MASESRHEQGRIRCRNYARGNCRWGANCQFSHENVSLSAQICRNFQRGYCFYGDRCRFSHIHTGVGGVSGPRRGSEPSIQSIGGRFPTDRRGSEPVLVPGITSGRFRRGSEPIAPQLMPLNIGIQEDVEEDKESPPKDAPSNWAMASEFIPRLLPQQQGSQDVGAEALQICSESVIGKVPSSSACETSCSESSATQPSSLPPCKVVSDLSLPSSSIDGSKEVVCGICMDKVHEKPIPEERCFGILPNCNHPYCLGCIRKWRNSKDFKNEIIKSCPECRVKSSYYIPNKQWVSEENEKLQLIQNFKEKTSKIRCKFYVRSNGHCPFKSECIYLHEFPPGYRPSRRQERRRRRHPRRSPILLFDDDTDEVNLLQYAIALAILDDDEEDDFLDYYYNQAFDLFWATSDSDFSD
ncbi:probable E3 ubiquitin-protein ligase makorin-2 isoform X2 [Protopterus annectens]|uniref:probable E3 ubiquitin-protein ligase makorin-2 isoform X2 n=1 Tax=Protopterus annectens TaxID=7888 RepID=UPI001CFBA515|nr:probable E3 ubiquitin-protein ligase makorin-2 isoform X2 [Protopterus annectens]